jgi:2-C-methyl-D-erythritol 2,4-cyclodiphosphate synthase
VRIGFGYDVHRLEDDRPLVLGGVVVPHGQGLAGHSDADVLSHAIIDALLGAAALGDIGTHFPDTDARWKGADSLALLAHVVWLIQEQQWRVGNVDATLVLQRPILRGYIPEMRTNLARVLAVEIGAVSVKATTGESMGFVGREEGAAAHAACLLMARES